MVKLNYINRKSEGVKLGAIVRKDLGKRKSSKSSHKDTSPIDLHLERKALTDAGLQEVAKGLIDTLTPDASWSDKLTALNLAKNGLTATSLGHLAPAICAAADDLQEINLSDNEIQLVTDDDITNWEAFLAAFSRCRHMRRLDLSGNRFTRPRAWESLARIFTEHFRSSRDLWDEEVEGAEDDETMSVDNEGMENLSIQDADDSSPIVSRIHTNDLSQPSRSSGLPAIRHINLTSTGLTDAGSLFLTYILERHRFVTNDIEGLLWLRRPEDSSDYAGISYSTEAAGPVAAAILKDAETAPFHPFRIYDTETEQSEGASPVSSRKTSTPAFPLKPSNHYSVSNELEASRIVRNSAAHNILPQGAAASLDKGRRKLQRTTIEEHQPREIELWMSALRLLCSVREYLTGEASVPSTASYDWNNKRESDYRTPPKEPKEPQWQQIAGCASENIKWSSYKQQELYSTKLSIDTGTSPQSASSTISPKTVASHVFRRRNLSKHGGSSSSLSDTQSGISSPRDGARASKLLAKLRPAPEMVGKLPLGVWVRILCLIADPKTVLSDRQIRTIVKHGRDRSTLTSEREMLKKTESVQIWWVLESLGCLTYEDDNSA